MQESAEQAIAALDGRLVLPQEFLPWVVTSQLMLVIAIPIAEELAFRRIIFVSIEGRFGPAVGIAISSALFAAAHAGTGRVASALIFGVAAAVVYRRTRNIWICIAGHASWNLIVMTASVFDLGPRVAGTPYPIRLAVFAAVSLLAVAMIRSLENGTTSRSKEVRTR
jgi:membrane protease YdiL (CAAX protease family)